MIKLLEPVSLFVYALVVLVWLARKRGDKKLVIASLSVLMAFVIIASPIFANGLTYMLEGAGEPKCAKVNPGAIVILGGGVDQFVMSPRDFSRIQRSSFRRVQGAIELAEQESELEIVISGGGPQAVPESELLKNFMQQQGVAAGRLTPETQSMNTRENGQNSVEILRRRHIDSIYLVTSALHMPRARRVFQKLGFAVCAHPVDRTLVVPTWQSALIPQISALEKTTLAAREMLGLAWYKLSGWI